MTSFALATQLIKTNYLVELPTEATPQYPQKLTYISITNSNTHKAK